MRGGKLHGLMGYEYVAPDGTTPTTDVAVADEFVVALAIEGILHAWLDTNLAHKWADEDHECSPLNPVAIFRNANDHDQVEDTADFPTNDSTQDDFTCWYIYWEGDGIAPDYVKEYPAPSKTTFNIRRDNPCVVVKRCVRLGGTS